MCADRDVLQLEIKQLWAQLEITWGTCNGSNALQLDNKWLVVQLKDVCSKAEKLRLDLLKAKEWSVVTPLAMARTTEAVTLTPSILESTTSPQSWSAECSGESSSRRTLPSVPPPVIPTVSSFTFTADMK